MERLLTIVVFALAAHALSGCDDKTGSVSAQAPDKPAADPAYASARRAPGRDLALVAPPTDFSGASPEDASRQASAMFDGASVRDAVSAIGYVPGAAPAARAGRRLPYTAAVSEIGGGPRIVEPPSPDPYDGFGAAAAPGSAREAGQTLLGFATFQLEQKFPSAAPIMSRLGWRAAPRRGANQAHAPYRVTVHHTQGRQPMNEEDAALETKAIQRYHMVGRSREGKENFSDIGYQFLIAGDGRVIEGRRAEYLGAHVAGGNNGNIGIAVMGDFDKMKPTAAQVESLGRLVTYLAIKYRKNPASSGFLEGHRHYNNTECPGRNLMAILDALRAKINHQKEVIMEGELAGASGGFQPLAVLGAPSA